MAYEDTSLLLKHLDGQEVQQLARDLHEAYVNLVRQTHPKYCVSSAYDAIFWKEFALKIHAIGGNAKDYMLYQYRSQNDFKKLRTISSDVAIEKYRCWIQEDDARLSANSAIECVFRNLDEHLRRGFSLRTILTAKVSPLTPLVRYCLAVADEQSDLVALFAPAAAAFLKDRPEYRSSVLADLFGELFPDLSELNTAQSPDSEVDINKNRSNYRQCRQRRMSRGMSIYIPEEMLPFDTGTACRVTFLSNDLKRAFLVSGKNGRRDYAVRHFRDATSSSTAGCEDAYWRDLALRLLPIGEDGADYMEFQFRHGPYPKSLIDIRSAAALDAYRCELRSVLPIVRANESVVRQLGLIEARSQHGRPLQKILMEEAVHINPLISYCFAFGLGCTELIAQNADDAVQFLKRYPDYRAALGPLFFEPTISG